MTGGDPAGWRELNRVNWDDRVPVHLASEFYDVGGLRSGAGSLGQVVTALAAAGLRIGFLREHDFDYCQGIRSLDHPASR